MTGRPPARRTQWARTRVGALSLTTGLVLLVLGALAGRPEVALLGLAPALAALRDLQALPSDELHATARPGTTPGRPSVELRVPASTEARAVRLRAALPGGGVRTALVRAHGGRSVGLRNATVRTGPAPAPTLEVAGLGPGLAWAGVVERLEVPEVVVLPRALPLGQAPVPARLRGHTGAHEARTLGDGGSLRDVHVFGPGDTLRRIDWRTTARRSPRLQELYVRRTHALAEAAVVLVLDARTDLGPDPSTWGPGDCDPRDRTSLDLAREAAATLAQHYLGHGDRVGIEDLSSWSRPLRPGAGRRHLDRVLHQLAQTAPRAHLFERVRAPHIATGSLVYVMSTFLDDQPAALAEQWRRAGHPVVAVDVLPELRLRRLDPRQRLALRMLQVTRADRLAALGAAGVDCVHWAAVGEAPGAALAAIARRSRR